MYSNDLLREMSKLILVEFGKYCFFALVYKFWRWFSRRFARDQQSLSLKSRDRHIKFNRQFIFVLIMTFQSSWMINIHLYLQELNLLIYKMTTTIMKMLISEYIKTGKAFSIIFLKFIGTSEKCVQRNFLCKSYNYQYTIKRNNTRKE